jgi:hypothetical protein
METAPQQDASQMPFPRRIVEPVDLAGVSIERVNAWLGSGHHAAAYGDALVLLAR